ncbi:MAG TPA: DNA-3-methyladenine glycosylase [Solirubrobacteraceae bacterium]|jgi:DNA-3-methyladenine glycosylase|nr:DNA-3-methyladenine glycosylase [Solirubrobacteraceae bacterium]
MAAALEPDFYARPVLEVARALIGCTVRHGETAGLIVETEAYHDSEPACHAFVGLTPRTSTLFGPPGVAYVYRSYGIHVMLNAVCEAPGVGAAVLIRALLPTAGIELMRARRGQPARSAGAGEERELCSGPGKLTQALGVTLAHNGTSLRTGPVRICGRARESGEPRVLAGPRVGITKAAELPWRFCLDGCAHVSRPHPWPRAGRRGSAAGGDAAGR